VSYVFVPALTPNDARYILAKQEAEEPLSGNEQIAALRLIDSGLLGMDGFRFCTVEEARENWRLCHKSFPHLR
jgi:hypothetical protein